MSWKYCLALLVATASILPALGREGRAGEIDSVESIARWLFDSSEDVNYDGWPDAWRRRIDRDHPNYLKMRLTPKQPDWETMFRGADAEWMGYYRLARGILRQSTTDELPLFWTNMLDRYLRVEMNGGAAWIESPRFPVSEDFSYYLTSRLMTEGFKRNQAWIELVFYDARDQVIASHRSDAAKETQDWIKVAVGPHPTPSGAVSVSVRLRVDSTTRPDVHGAAGFDRVHLRRFPQLLIQCDEATGLYAQSSQPKIVCTLSGLSKTGAAVRLALTDVHGHILQQHEAVAELGTAAIDGFYSGHVEWEPEIPGAGWYSVSARLMSSHSVSMEGRKSFVLLGDLPSDANALGPFGISLADGVNGIPLQRWPAWLEQLRVGWVKIPMWLLPNDRTASDQMAWLTERLSDRGIRTVGILSQPPAELRKAFPGSGPLPAATLFREMDTWQEMLEPQMSRLSLRVAWWQVGGDRDLSFADIQQPQELLEKIRVGLQGFGQPVSLVVGWPALDPPPNVANLSGWNAISLRDATPLTAQEIIEYVDARKNIPQQTWLSLNPLPKSSYPLQARVQDLVERMIAVRHDDTVKAAIADETMSTEQGLLYRDGSPTEMLLPWRTTASLIGTLHHVGKLKLPNRSENILMANENRAVLVVWNQTATEENGSFGQQVAQYDVWGQHQTISSVAGKQTFSVGPWPTFITGVDPVLARWRMGVSVPEPRIDSLLGRRQEFDIVVRNPFGSAASGQVRVLAPEAWQIDPRGIPFTVDPNGETRVPVSLVLRPDAGTGPTTVQLEFTIDSDRAIRFQVLEDMEVGPPNLSIELTASIDSSGNMVVRQEMINSGDTPVRLDCYLFPQGRQLQRAQLYMKGRDRLLKQYVLERGEELMGPNKVFLTVDDRDSERRMNYPLNFTQ